MNWISPYYSVWTEGYYKNNQLKTFEIVDNYLKSKPTTILDIGAGFAYVSQLFQEKYNSDLYLLDGEFDGNVDKRHNKYGSTETMSFYAPLKDLKTHYDSQGMRYVQVDANNVNIDKDVKFDLIYSFLSCGFHYPIGTYINLMLNHSHDNTVIIMDIRRKTNLKQDLNYKIINVLEDTGKFFKCHIKLL